MPDESVRQFRPEVIAKLISDDVISSECDIMAYIERLENALDYAAARFHFHGGAGLLGAIERNMEET